MRTVFEAEQSTEITQVALWTAYRLEFEATRVDILPASEVIKMVSEAFPAALPMVTEIGDEKKFIINGIRIRDRTGELAISVLESYMLTNSTQLIQIKRPFSIVVGHHAPVR